MPIVTHHPGSWFNLLTLLIVGWCSLFALPKLYLNNQVRLKKKKTIWKLKNIQRHPDPYTSMWLWFSQESVDEIVGMVMGKVEGIKGTVGELKDKVFGKSIIQDQSQPWSLNDQCPQRGAGVYVLFYKRKKILKRWLNLGGCSCSNRGAERRVRERNNDKKK